MSLEIPGRHVLIVGGANGIGWEIASQFAGQGLQISVIDICHEMSAPIPAEQFRFVQADIVDPASLDSAIQQVTQLAVDHTLFCAAIGSGKTGFPFWNVQPSDWERVLKVNLQGAVNVTHALVPNYVSQKKGSLTYLASVAGQIGSQTDPPYSASKAALINFMQCVAKDFAPYNVRANAISPGMVKTQLNQSVWQASQGNSGPGQQTYEQWGDEKVRRIAPLGRWQTPRDIANAALFLASDFATNITGQTINVDGGQVMHS